MPTLSGFTVLLADRVRETTQTTGTGTYSLEGAPTGKRTFVAGVGSGNRTVYVAESGASWEIGIGTVTSGAPSTLSRDAILASSNSNNAVSWAGGVKDIFGDIPAALVAQIIEKPVVSVKTTVRTTTGTFTRDAKCIAARVRIVGGGGGGGGTPATGSNVDSDSSGGGGAAYREGYFTAAKIGSSLTVTIGDGGAGGIGGSDGSAGGTTSFGALMSAPGGGGGGAGTATAAGASSSPTPGSGGTGGSGGYLLIAGGDGGRGRVSQGVIVFGGWGGPSHMGGTASSGSSSPGTAGKTYGGGGAGIGTGQNSAGKTGGVGGSGVCIVEEYLSP